MSVIVMDPTAAKLLRTASTRTELRDADGHVLGVYVPAPTSAHWEPEFTAEELDATAAEPGRSLQSILADLRSRS